MNIGLYYPRLVKEFIVNLPSSFSDVGNAYYSKVCVKGHLFEFSPIVINDYLVRGRQTNASHFPSLKTIDRDITRNVHEDCPSKGLVVVGNMNVKYDIRYKIGLTNYAPLSHG